MGIRLSGLSKFYLFNRALEIRNRDVFRASEQLSSNKRINRISDDPVGARIAMGFKEQLAQIEQYKSNLATGDRWLTSSETALQSVNELLIRAKELAIQGNNGTLSGQTRAAIADEVQQLSQQLLQFGNTQINGEYIFSGFATSTEAFELNAGHPNANPAASYNGDPNNQKAIQITSDSTLTVQSDGNTVFLGDGTAETVDLFQTLADLEQALRDGDLDEASATGVPQMIDDLTVGQRQVLSEITSIGAKANRTQALKAQLESETESFKAFVGDIEDADFAQVAFEFQRAQLALQATLGSANNAFNLPSLMDFINR